MSKEEIEIVNDTGYGMINRSIMRIKGLSITAKAIYSYLASFAGNTAKAFPSVSLMINELGISKTTFHKYKDELVDKGIIKIEQERDKGKFMKNIYYLSPCPKKWDTIISDTVKMGYHKMDTNSNNSNSNNNYNNNSNNNKQTKKQTGMDYIENSNESEEVKEVFKEFIKNRIAMKSPVTEFGAKKLLNSLNKMYKTDKDKIECIEQSIMNGWKGLFPISGRKNNTPNAGNYKNKEDTPEEMEEAKKRLEKLAREQGIKT